MAAPRWKENQLRKLEPSDGVLTTREDWVTWTLGSSDKFDAMDYKWFISAAQALILVNNKFNFFVNHPTPDTIPSPVFMKAVITYLVAHGLVFPVAADNVNPADAAKHVRNYTHIIKVRKGIQSQLSDACA
eukprot:1399278-Rhodomonas_salina.1